MLFESKNLTKRFGGLQAIGNLDFSVRKGEILGIIGPNGSGKSTLFNLMTGFLPVTSGEIFYQGKNITGLTSYSISLLGIARTFQKTRILPNKTVWDNIAVGAMQKMKHSVWDPLIRRGKKDIRLLYERCDEVLNIIGLEEYFREIAGELDQEKQKRIAIGIGLATGPKLLLLDEPSGGINLEEITQLISIIQKVVNKGITICLIEHKMKMVMRLCERIIVLNHGKKIAEGTPVEIVNNAETIKAYLGDKDAAKYK